MPRRTLLAILLVQSAFWMAPAEARGGDPEAAEFFFTKGEKAYRAKDYEHATESYRRALDESPEHAGAAYGLAQSLEKLGRKKEALDAYIRSLGIIDGKPKLTRNLKRTRDRAKKAIGRLGSGYSELGKLDEQFIRDCLSFAKRYAKSARIWARRAYSLLLEFDPHHKHAREQLEELGGAIEMSAPSGGYEPLILDDRLKTWDPGTGEGRGWSCRNGVIRCDPPNRKGQNNYPAVRCSGTYSIRASFRRLKEKEGSVAHGINFGVKEDDSMWAVYAVSTGELVLVHFDESGFENKAAGLILDFDPTVWHVIQVDVAPGQVSAFVDGKRVLIYPDQPDRAFDGITGLLVQASVVDIRDYGVKR